MMDAVNTVGRVALTVGLAMASRTLDWFGWNVLGGMPTGIRKPSLWLLKHGPYHWGMALYNREWLKS